MQNKYCMFYQLLIFKLIHFVTTENKIITSKAQEIHIIFHTM